jgi:asparagine synthase (glutamine-hydrolysing)
MLQININISSDKWSVYDEGCSKTYLRGFVYKGNDAETINEVHLSLRECCSISDFGHLLKTLNGFYALIYYTGSSLVASVDHARTLPIFYAFYKEQFVISDDPEWVRSRVGVYHLDPIARAEFSLVGYVTGEETLYPDVKQLQAGEVLEVKIIGDRFDVKRKQYYNFTHIEPSTIDQSDLDCQLDVTVHSSIRRLIKYANGRKIVIPLSGGYDSRLIATLLKKAGYSNLIAFTYGLRNNKESTYSKYVADSLGIRWEFVEYSRIQWSENWVDEDRRIYQRNATAYNSVAHFQDWLAVKVLIKERIIDQNSILVPGHSGDFVAGSHIPKVAFEKTHFQIQDVINAIFERHYVEAPNQLIGIAPQVWHRRINQRLSANNVQNQFDFANLVENWDWRERQSKYINNAVRVYEFFGCDWWMPLWDREFVDFWMKVPLKLREGRNWYKLYVQKQFELQSGSKNQVPISNASDRNYWLLLLFSSRFGKSIKANIFLRYLYYYRVRPRGSRDPLEGVGGYSVKQYRELKASGFSTVGVLAQQYLNELLEHR